MNSIIGKFCDYHKQITIQLFDHWNIASNYHNRDINMSYWNINTLNDEFCIIINLYILPNFRSLVKSVGLFIIAIYVAREMAAAESASQTVPSPWTLGEKLFGVTLNLYSAVLLSIMKKDPTYIMDGDYFSHLL